MDRITKKAPYGVQIELRCKCHPEKRWSTKNISHIGARTIFYNLNWVPEMDEECNCPASLLEVMPIDGPDVEE